MLIPMPSPTGRNNARLFAHGPVARALGAAYDSRSGLAYGSRRVGRDADPPPPDDTGSMHGQDPDEGLDQIKVFLRNRLDPQDFARLEAMLQALNGSGSGEREDLPPDDSGSMHYQNQGGAGDEPEPGESLLPNGRNYQNIPEENRREVRGEGKDRRFAQDSRSGGGGYFSMFPANAKVGTSNYGS
jgi:hypothetical protein